MRRADPSCRVVWRLSLRSSLDVGRLRLSHRQGHYCLKSTFGTVAQLHGPAVRLTDCPSDGKAQTDAPGIAAARPFKAHKRFKHCLQLITRQTRPVVRDRDDDEARRLRQRDLRRAAVVHRIVDQVTQGSLQCRRAVCDRNGR